MRSAFRQARGIVKYEQHITHTSLPTFLCPALLRTPIFRPILRGQGSQPSEPFSTFGHCKQQATAVHDRLPTQVPDPESVDESPPALHPSLPRACPGCGAPSQFYDKNEAGYYNTERRQVKTFLNHDPVKTQEENAENGVFNEALKNADPKLLEELGLTQETLATPSVAAIPAPETPVCDRCHNLVHHHVGTPIHHPSVDAIQQTIAESPHRRNHIYHVVDAADFPLSLVPNLQSALRLPKLRTQNRRAKHKGWVANNRIAEVSFVITRADLLAPMKEQVDKLLPYMQEVLRAALGRVNKDARLGNIHLVSAKRGWWTKKVKEDIWERGGAGWMVGKVNVGKSNLFEVVFPKGRGPDHQDVHKIRTAAEREQAIANAKSFEEATQIQKELEEEDAEIERRRRQPVLEPEEQFPEEEEDIEPDDEALLPPRQPYTPYPVLPIASSLPGTTASPIRIPFGRNRGELIDLPGLARTNPDLSTFVKAEDHDQLVMKARVTPQRHVLKPGQSLILGGGLIRITPVTEDLIFLVHPFVPLAPHVTSTEKAIGLQARTRESNIPSVLSPKISPSQLRSAGTFKLRWDVTKKLAGPLTSSMAGKMKPENLPWQIFSTDILIEGVGWVEISAQVRKPRGWKPVGLVKKDPNHAKIERERRMEEDRLRIQKNYQEKIAATGGGDAFDRAGITSYQQSRETKEKERRREVADEFVDNMVEQYPEVEVFSPLGKYIGARMPMCGSVLGGPKPVSTRDRQARPRRAMKPIRGKETAAKKEMRRETSG